MKNNTIIFGDSYSTFENFVPDGYAVYYSEKGRPETDVTNVGETWWHQVIAEENLNLVINDSWSGSTIGYTGYDNADCSQSSSFICRLNRLINRGFFKENNINTVFVFGGINDSWAEAPLGRMKYDNFKEDDLYCVLPAICYFFKTIKETLPQADIFCMINTDLKPEISEGMKKACEKYGITKVVLKKIDKRCGHPTIKGMQDIKTEVLNVFKQV